MSWTCKREAMYMLVYKRVENDHTGVGRRITSLIALDIVPPQELSSILHFLNIFQSNKLR